MKNKVGTIKCVIAVLTLFAASMVQKPVYAAREVPVIELENYQEAAEVVSEQWQEDYFAQITVDTNSGKLEKDEEITTFSKEYDISQKKSEQVLSSVNRVEQFLEKQETENVFEVEKESNGTLTITAPYQTCRLIVEADVVADTCGAIRVYHIAESKETILEYETPEKTQQAYEALRKIYGEKCLIDQVYYADELLCTQTEDSCYSWGSDFIGLAEMKQTNTSFGYTRPVTVAVIDSGIDKNHPLFTGRLSSGSYNFANNNTSVGDVSTSNLPYGHGTHVSGIIADATPSNVKIMMLKVMNSKGYSITTWIRAAMYYAVRKNVDVINLSMCTEQVDCTDLDRVISYAYEKGIPICVAAGNEGARKGVGGNVAQCAYPANLQKPIVVSSINDGGKRSVFSNFGTTVDFAAPGENIVSAAANTNGKYVNMSGTSMAAPHVTAAIAYIKMMQPDLSVKGVEEELKSLSKDIGQPGKDIFFGNGIPMMSGLFSRGIVHTTSVVTPLVGCPAVKTIENTSKGIKITWSREKKAENYYIYKSTNGSSYQKVKTVSADTTTYEDRNVSAGKKYTYVVRAKRYEELGAAGTAKTIVHLKSVSGRKASKVSRGKAQLSWKKSSKVSYYQVQYATKSSMKSVKIQQVKKSKGSLRTKQLSGRYCYWRIRTCYVSGGKKYYSAWSSTTRVKIR